MTNDDHLNSNRIRQMAAIRRAAYRTRSYCVIAVGGCIGGAAQFAFFAVRRLRHGPGLFDILIAVAYFLAAAVLLGLARHFVRLAAGFHREAKTSTLPQPTAPPDFSQLQDGSQIAKNLEDM
jgi:hypothetical protein